MSTVQFHTYINRWQSLAPQVLVGSNLPDLFQVPPSRVCGGIYTSIYSHQEYAFDQVLVYKLETYTNSRFQISSYHDILKQHKKNQVWCAASEGYIYSLLKPAPKTPHASLASSGMPKALWHGFHFLRPLRLKWLLTPQLRKCDVEQGEETTLT